MVILSRLDFIQGSRRGFCRILSCAETRTLVTSSSELDDGIPTSRRPRQQKSNTRLSKLVKPSRLFQKVDQIVYESRREREILPERPERLVLRSGVVGTKPASSVRPVVESPSQSLANQRVKLPRAPSRSSPFIFSSVKSQTASKDTYLGQNDPAAMTPISTSLFDVFKLPDESDVCRSEEDQAFDDYLGLVQTEIVGNLRLSSANRKNPIPDEQVAQVEAWLKTRECLVKTTLPSLRNALEEGCSIVRPIDDEGCEGSFADEVLEQKKCFVSAMGWDNRQYKMAQTALFQMTNMCAKQARGSCVPFLWQKVKEAGISDVSLLTTLLHVAVTFGAGNNRKGALYGRLTASTAPVASVLEALDGISGNVGSDDSPISVIEVADEVAVYHDLLHEPTEQTITIRVRLLVAQGNPHEADRVLEAHGEQVGLRLRAYAPVLRLYLEQREIDAALHLYKRMIQMPLVHMDAETFIFFLAGLAADGVFRPGAPARVKAMELGYEHLSGPGLFDALISDMVPEVLEISVPLAKKLRNAFAEGFPEYGLERIAPLSSLKFSNEPAGGGHLIAAGVAIDPNTGRCPRSEVNLRLVNLEEDQRRHLKETLLDMARSSQLVFQQGKKRQSNAGDSGRKLATFYAWLDARTGPPFTAIVDGANVGYYMQNYDNGSFNFHQIQFVVDTLERLGEHPLVILPFKYSRDKFYVTIGAGGSAGPQEQRATNDDKAILGQLRDAGKLFVAPSGLLDDYCWILASVSDQTKSRNGEKIDVSPGDSEGRWPGARPVLISNDQMRDHKLELLEPLLFRRWYSNFIVNYNFPGFVGKECSHFEIGFTPASIFSREIQCNSRPDGSNAWHIPLKDCENEWFCISIPASLQST